jgi:hypothetical protein
VVWREFKPPFISGEIWTTYIEHVTSEQFSRHSQSGADNRNRQIHGSVTTHTGGSVAVWREFKPPFISGEIWTTYIEHVTSERFSRHSQSDADNRNRQIHGSVTTHTRGSVPFSAHAKRMVRLILMKYIVN